MEDKVVVADKRQLAMRTGYVECVTAPDNLRSPAYVCSAVCSDRTHKILDPSAGPADLVCLRC